MRRCSPQNDFLQGDFYGDSWQGSFVRKLLEDLTPASPVRLRDQLLGRAGRPHGDEVRGAAGGQGVGGHRRQCGVHLHRRHRPDRHAQPQGLRPDGPDLRPVDARTTPSWAASGSRTSPCTTASTPSSTSPATAGPSPRADTTDAHTKSVTAVTRRLGSRHLPFGFITKTTLAT